ncbi:resolvase [Clostridia bacterium]|nr:resolvase [Clostridia bacterium]
MEYGYCRCSTNETRQDIDRQKRELRDKGISEKNIYFEYESGTKEERVQLARLLEVVAEGDTIAATEVSRITRSTKQLCGIIELAKQKHLRLVVGSFVVDCTKELDPMTDGMLKMMGVFAEMERNMIKSRVRSGIANAKSKGAKIGRPKLSSDTLPVKFLRHYQKYVNKEIKATELADLSGIDRSTMYRYIEVMNKK